MKVEDLKSPQQGDHCLLCGGSPVVIGIFTPSDPIQWGAPTGKVRLIRYCLCSKCQGSPDTPEKVEKIIRVELAGGVIHE
jgi:hypothetical protein